MDAAKVAEVIPFLLAKPREWLVTGRGKYTFNLPTEYLLDPYRTHPELIDKRFPYLKKADREIINIKPLKELPDLRDVNMVARNETFSIFLAHHKMSSSILIAILLKQKTAEEFLSACVYVRDRVNPVLFAYAVSVAAMNREEKELKDVGLPSFVSTHPHFFLPSNVIYDARQEIVSFDATNRHLIEIPVQFTATSLEEEQRVAYFREDIGLNLHHWHWHLVYPHDGEGYTRTGTQLPTCYLDGNIRSIVNKDRRGELFYYMHQQMVARYNFERLSNKMARVRPLKDLQEPIAQGYYPKLIDVNSSKTWPSRQPNSKLKSLTRELEQIVIDINHMARMTDRILGAIDAGFVFQTVQDKDGNPTETLKKITLDEKQGIDILGNIVESSCLSINRDYYGDLHDMGHVVLSLIHDPDGRFKENVSVMGSNQTACRDPVFYRWHAQINDIFMAHKNNLRPYTQKELCFDGIKVTDVNIKVEDCETVNELRTFWQKDLIDISWGIDFARGEDDGPLSAVITHLQHKPFTYKIEYENSGKESCDGTVRIFMAPKFDESYQEFAFFHQRNLFIELDRFIQKLEPGKNVFERKSKDSSVTIPWEQTFKSLSHTTSEISSLNLSDLGIHKSEKQPGKGDPKAYCGCGWPAHLLIPRGSGEGLDVDLFVMITDSKEDKAADFHGPENDDNCRDAMSYCGLKDSLYPDKKPMGFPFDRRPAAKPEMKDKVYKLKDFLTDNMKVQHVKIRFTREEPLLCMASLESEITKSILGISNDSKTTAGLETSTKSGSETSAKNTTGSETSATSTTGLETSATSTTGLKTSVSDTTGSEKSSKSVTGLGTSAKGTTESETSSKTATVSETTIKTTQKFD